MRNVTLSHLPSRTAAITRMMPAGVSSASSVTGSLTGTMPVSISAVTTQIVFEPDIGGYSTCSMITKPASASGVVGGRITLQQSAGYPRGSRSITLRSQSWWSRRCSIFANIVSPGTGGRPAVTTRPGSPQAWTSTAVIMRLKRIVRRTAGGGGR